jgi:hypothetical protein
VSVRSPSFTILGARGFIGSALVAGLESRDCMVHAVIRAALPELLASRLPCGHVIACIGLAGDFRSRPIDTSRPDAEFGPASSSLSAVLPTLLAPETEHQCSPSTRPVAA